jgi:hypothetical protein
MEGQQVECLQVEDQDEEDQDEEDQDEEDQDEEDQDEEDQDEEDQDKEDQNEENRNKEDEFDDFDAFQVVSWHQVEPLWSGIEFFGLYEARLGLTIVQEAFESFYEGILAVGRLFSIVVHVAKKTRSSRASSMKTSQLHESSCTLGFASVTLCEAKCDLTCTDRQS